MYSAYQSNGHVFQVVSTPPLRDITDMMLDAMPGAYGMRLLETPEQHGSAHNERERLGQYVTTQHRTAFRRKKFAARQYMVITTPFQTFEGIVLSRGRSDFEYVSGFITYPDGRIE